MDPAVEGEVGDSSTSDVSEDGSLCSGSGAGLTVQANLVGNRPVQAHLCWLILVDDPGFVEGDQLFWYFFKSQDGL